MNSEININKDNQKRTSLISEFLNVQIGKEEGRNRTTSDLQSFQNNNTSFKSKTFQIKDDITFNSLNKNINYIESPIGLYIDDNNFKQGEFIIRNHQCRFEFDYKILLELLNKVHFTPKYFEFPIFYFFKGTYNEKTKTITITLKDYRSYKILAHSDKILTILKNSSNNKQDLISYAKNYKVMQEKENIKYPKNGWKIYDPFCEYLRQGIDFSDNKFSFSEKNLHYKLCETYPRILVIPSQFDNDEIYNIAGSRMKNRFPVLSYFYHKCSQVEGLEKKNIEIKSYLYRSSQIKTEGIIFKGKNLEIEYLNKIMNMENNNIGFIIFDCRPSLNAKANTFKGAGTDDIKNYNNCKELIFGDIENIHAVRKSLKSALLKAYYGKEAIVKGKVAFNIDKLNMKNFLSKFEDTKWLQYISDLLMGGITVANNLKKGINVLVHCSDGWDRTPQICCLAQIILEPFYRTIEGFAVLIEKEWVSFGHQFATRNGCNFKKGSKTERSPIFIQFIHAVHQMTLQFPTAFEFNSNLLLFLCRELFSNKYGTFLFNCEKDIVQNEGKKNTISIWSDIFLEKNNYINDIYKEVKDDINVKGELQYLDIWNDYFFQFDKLGRVKDNNIYIDKGDNLSNVVKENKKSILELLKIIKENGMEDKMKDNKFYNLYKDEL